MTSILGNVRDISRVRTNYCIGIRETVSSDLGEIKAQ